MTIFPPPLLPTLSTLGVRCELLAIAQGPFGTLSWLEVTPTAKLRSMSTAPGVSFHETKIVARLRARNRSVYPVLVPGNVIVDGGRQARVIESSVVLAPGVEAEIPVRCVEKGRWHAKKDSAPSDDFEISGGASSRTRSIFAKNKSERLTSTGKYDLDQRAVWTHVGDELERAHVRSSTQSYADFLEDGKSRRARQARDVVDGAPLQANGLVLTHASGHVWVEVFSERADLLVAAESLVHEVFEAADASPDGRPSESPREMIARAWQQPLQRVELPLGTLGTAFALRADETCGSVLLVDGRLAHLGITNAPVHT